MLRSEILVRATAQLTPDPLLGIEKIPIGGLNTVRGYRENQFVRDNGLAGAVELRIILFRRPASESESTPLNLKVALKWAFGAPVGGAGAGKLEAVTRDRTLRTGDQFKMMVELEWLCSLGGIRVKGLETPVAVFEIPVEPTLNSEGEPREPP